MPWTRIAFTFLSGPSSWHAVKLRTELPPFVKCSKFPCVGDTVLSFRYHFLIPVMSR